MSNVLKSKGFKYLKNLLIGVGASVVLIGALFKIMSWPFADEALIIGMGTEAILFLFLGLIGPDKDYYWEKLYPGLDDYSGAVNPISQAGQVAQQNPVPKEMVEKYVNNQALLNDFDKLNQDLHNEGYFKPDISHVVYRCLEIFAMHIIGLYLLLTGANNYIKGFVSYRKIHF
jgi:gliding motility-associated protein GldL